MTDVQVIGQVSRLASLERVCLVFADAQAGGGGWAARRPSHGLAGSRPHEGISPSFDEARSNRLRATPKSRSSRFTFRRRFSGYFFFISCCAVLTPRCSLCDPNGN